MLTKRILSFLTAAVVFAASAELAALDAKSGSVSENRRNIGRQSLMPVNDSDNYSAGHGIDGAVHSGSGSKNTSFSGDLPSADYSVRFQDMHSRDKLMQIGFSLQHGFLRAIFRRAP